MKFLVVLFVILTLLQIIFFTRGVGFGKFTKVNNFFFYVTNFGVIATAVAMFILRFLRG
jgi:hypothetical protein